MYQFMHLDAYSRVGNTQKRDGKTSTVRSARDIANEAERVDGYCDHVKEIQQPTIVFGCAPSQAVDLAESWAQQAKDSQGRKLRRDGMIIAAGTISAPREAVESGELDWQKFKDDCILWLQKTYGNRLLSVVQHLDEANPHIHFYCVPQPGESFEILHPGIKAKNEIRRDKRSSKGAAGIAFRNAMCEFQNDFFTSVAVRHGMVRLGPRRQRLTNSEYKKNLIAAREVAKTYEILEQKTSLEAESKELEQKAAQAEEKAQNAIAAKQKAQTEKAQLDREKAQKEEAIKNTTLMSILLPVVKMTATITAAAKLKLGKKEIEAEAEKRGRKQQLEHDQIAFKKQTSEKNHLAKENAADRLHFQSVLLERNAAIEQAKEAKKVPVLEAKNEALAAENLQLKSELATFKKSGPKGP